MRSIAVFCGAFIGLDPAYERAAQQLGLLLGERDVELVWGGGHIGLMGVVADAVLGAGGRTYGVIPEFMADRELVHKRSTEIIIVNSMHERKAQMAARADAFIALPGGLGTLDELFEIITWSQLHLHEKPIGILNVKGFFDALLAYLDHCSSEGFIRRKHIDLINIDSDAVSLLEKLKTHQSQTGEWLESINF